VTQQQQQGSTKTSTSAAVATPAVDLAVGLLGAPATNPVVIQAQQQEETAAEEAQAIADEEAAAQANAAVGITKATGETANGTTVQPAVASTQWADPPPSTYALPEIPTVFLNVAA
jgi:hypothetical protein